MSYSSENYYTKIHNFDISVLNLCLSERDLQSCMMEGDKKRTLNFQYTLIILKNPY